MTAPLDAAQVLDARHRLTPIACLLPAIELSPAERMALSGHLFVEAPEVVARVLAALEERPALYAAHATDPVHAAEAAELRGRHERARALRCVHEGLMILARRAADLALLDEAEVTARCLAIVRTARDDAAERPGPGAAERQEGLRGADLIVRRRAARRGGRRLDRRDRARPAAAGRRAAPRALAARDTDDLLDAVAAGLLAPRAAPCGPAGEPVHRAAPVPPRPGIPRTSAPLAVAGGDEGCAG